MQRYTVIAFLIFSSFSLALANNTGAKVGEEQKQIDILLSDAVLFEKVTACQRLARIGTGKSVEALSSLLCDESLRGYARYAMEGIDDARVDQAFRKALGECTGEMRIGIINSIGVRRDAKAAGQLSKLAMDPASGASSQALAALGRIASGDAINTIKEAMKSDSQTLRLAAGDAALTAAERLLIANKKRNALKLYVAVAKADVPKHLHTAALYSEIMARGSESLPLLIKQLKSDDPAMVAVALRGARDLPGTKVTKKLVKELRKLSPETQVLLIKVLVDRDDPAAVKSIQALVFSKNADVRSESLKALGQIGDTSSIPILLKAACSDSKQATIALVSLRILKVEGVDEAIIAYMKKTTPAAKAKLIKLLSDRDATVGLDEIFAATKDKNTKVQIAAFKAIGQLASAENIDTVIKLLGSVDDDVRRDAERAVISVARKITEDSEQTDAIITAYQQEKNVQTRCSFLRVLSAFADENSFKAIESAMDDSNEKVKDVAVRAITAWPNTEAMSTILAIFKNTDNKSYRVLALRGYIRLVRRDKQTAAEKKAEILGEIMGLVNTAAERITVLSGLATIGHPSAMAITSKYISDPDVKDEAMQAAIQIGQSIAAARPEQVKHTAQQIVKATSSDTVRDQAQAILKTIESFEDFIVSWQVSQQYLQAGKNYSQLFDIEFAPETDGDVEWPILPGGTNLAKSWLLEPGKLYSGDDRVAYFSTWVNSATQQKARLELGSDDGIKAWLNGQLVHANNAARAAIPASDRADVQLEKGWNKLMLKVTQNQGPWEFCIRLCDLAGNKLEGIKVDCLYQEQATPLFDGKTFTGFEGDLNWFRIEDGAIVAGKLTENIPHNFFLATTKEYYNFELRLKVKTSAPAVNGGIQFRSKRIPNHHEVSGYQADIAGGIWGALYDESRRGRFLVPPHAEVQKTIKDNDWNDYKIRCVNDRVQLFVNGVKTVGFVESDATAMHPGIIALQIHQGPPAEVWYKDITIKELSKVRPGSNIAFPGMAYETDT